MPKILQPKEMNKCLGCLSCMNVCSVLNRSNHSLIKSRIKIRTTGGMSSKYIAIVCLGCLEPACKEVCPSDALTNRPGGGVILTENKCIGCRQCIDACIMRAVNFDEESATPLICKHCSLCTMYCPHDCLQMVDVEEVIPHAQ